MLRQFFRFFENLRIIRTHRSSCVPLSHLYCTPIVPLKEEVRRHVEIVLSAVVAVLFKDRGLELLGVFRPGGDRFQLFKIFNLRLDILEILRRVVGSEDKRISFFRYPLSWVMMASA